MKQKTYTTAVATLPYSYFLGSVFIVMVILNLYFAFYTAYLYADTKNTENYSKELQGPLAIIEAKYMEATKEFDIIFAYKNGFLNGTSKTEYITRQSHTARVDN